ncbi:MAG: polyprenyl synthetase family protein, partial [Flavobacteriales bacterium]
MELLAPYLLQIENGIKELNLSEKPVNLYEPFRYVLSIGGKRIRPTLTLIACEICEGNKNHALHAALAVELFHNFTLVHDDIMDNAPIRRNRPTVHEQWNRNIAILTGDVMLVKAYEQINKLPHALIPEAFALFNKTASQICEGQQMDMDFEDRIDVQMEDYVEMIRLKTAVLLGCALQLGSLCSATPTANGEHLYQFGVTMGMAFQVKDDFLDAYGEVEKFGKLKGGDIIANKKTFLFLKFMEKASDIDKREMLNLYSHERVPEALKVKRVLELFAVYSIDKEMK